jgi:hypothetical protein
MFLQKMQNNDSKKLRGRSAIQAAHHGITVEDEARLDVIISNLYGVNIDEAEDIHLNYHVDRILAIIARRGGEKGIKTNMLAERLQRLDLAGAAYQVAKGKLSEPGAIDALFRALAAMENPDKNDSHLSFYG